MESNPIENIKKPVYGIIDSGTFGFRVISGIVTGVRFTEEEPVYTIQFGKDRWETKLIAHSQEELSGLFKLPTLARVKETHGLTIKYGK